MNNLYETIEKENIIFRNNYINENTKGICIKLPNKKTAIIIDKNKINNSIEERCILAEELGHYYHDSLYSPLCDDKSVIERNEYRAKKFAFKAIIGDKLKNNITKYKNMLKYEIAEELGVTEELLNLAYEYYILNKVS